MDRDKIEPWINALEKKKYVITGYDKKEKVIVGTKKLKILLARVK